MVYLYYFLSCALTLFDQGLGTILGWGVSTRDGKTSSVLRKAKVPLIPELVCKLHYDDFRILSNICAGGSIQDTCFGDSGGPLLCGENPYVLCGVSLYVAFVIYEKHRTKQMKFLIPGNIIR